MWTMHNVRCLMWRWWCWNWDHVWWQKLSPKANCKDLKPLPLILMIFYDLLRTRLAWLDLEVEKRVSICLWLEDELWVIAITTQCNKASCLFV